jgi:hypothetical protein
MSDAIPTQQPPAQSKTNTFAIVSLVTALVGISIAGVIFGHLSLNQIKKTNEDGKGLAIAGLVIGYVGCAGWILGIFGFFLALAVAGSSMSY